MSQILELNQSLLPNHSTDQSLHTYELEDMDSVTFLSLLDQQKVEFNRKKVIIDKAIKITNLIELKGQSSLFQFIGGSLVFQGDEYFISKEEHCIIQGFQIEVNQSTPCIITQNRNFQLIACNINSQQRNDSLIDFDNSLYINDTTINGFAQIANCNKNSCKLHIANSIIECDSASTLLYFKNIDNCIIQIENSKFDGCLHILQLFNCSNINILLKDNEFINQKIILQFESLMNNEIVIIGNQFVKAQDLAIKMKDIVVYKLIFQNNLISKCKIGMLMENVMKISQIFKSIEPITFKQNILSNMEQSALMIKEVVCLEIDALQIIGNTIGLELDLSTSKPNELENVNPFIVSISNSNFQSNRIHGIFINSNLELNPIFLQLSRTLFTSNCNALSLSHQGEQKNNRLKINIYNCQFYDKNICNSNPNYDIIFTNSNQQKQQQQKTQKNTCQIM